MKCRDCEYAFEHLIGYNNYVCDVDVKPIQLDQERADCPKKPKQAHTPCDVCSHQFYHWDNKQPVLILTCKGCGDTQEIKEKEAA